MTEDDDEPDGPLEVLVAIVAVVTLPAGILAAIFLDGGTAGIVFVVGWLLLVPVLAILSEYVDPKLTGDRDASSVDDAVDQSAATDPLDRLRERYATGEIGEAEFERRLERLIETEDVEVSGDVDVDRLIEDGSAAAERNGAGAKSDALADERERETEGV